MIPVTDEHKFWQLTPDAAAELFKYRDENSEVKDGPWGFDRGNASDDKTSAYAIFSHVAISGWGKDVLILSARKQADGSWRVTHEIERAA